MPPIVRSEPGEAEMCIRDRGGYYADANNGWTNTISKYNPTDNWTNEMCIRDR